MLSAHRPLVRAQEPAFKQRGNTINAGHADVGRIPARKNNPLIPVTALRQFVVAAPSIGQDLGDLFDNVSNEGHKTSAEHVRNPKHSHPSEPLWRMNFYRNIHDLFPFAPTPSFAVHIPAANRCLIRFNAAAKLITPRANHGVPHFVQPCPSGLITPQPKNAFQYEGPRAVLSQTKKPDISFPPNVISATRNLYSGSHNP